MAADPDRVLNQLASVAMLGRIQQLRDRTEQRVDGYRDRYAPILSRLTATEWLGLIEACGGEIERRGDAVAVTQQAIRETLAREAGRG